MGGEILSVLLSNCVLSTKNTEESNNNTHLDMAAKSTRGSAALRFRSGSMRTIDVDFFRDTRSAERPVSIGHSQETA